MNVKTIICGGDQTYIVNEDGSMYSSGDNRFGQLSHGDYENTNKLELVVFKEKPSSPSIIHNISDNYGVVSSVPNITYNVTDADMIDSEIIIVEYIDNIKVWEGNIKNGDTRIFDMSRFDSLDNSEHTLKIEAKDRQRHLVTKTSKFTKFVTYPSEIIIEKSDYGKKYYDFDVSFKVFDKDKEDINKLTLKYFIDENLIDTKNNVSNSSIIYKIKFDNIKDDGKHELKITCIDTQNNNISKIIKFEKITKYEYSKYTIKNESKGDFISTIIDDDGKYPDNGPKDGYWYVKGKKYVISNEKDLEKINSNSVPSISGTNSNLGSKHSKFEIPYIVTDNDTIDDTISIQEIIDNEVIKIHSVKNGVSNTVYISDDIIKKLTLGKHTCYIIATDKQNHVVIRTYEFNRDLDLRILFTDNEKVDLENIDDNGFTLEYKILGSENQKYRVTEKIQGENITINTFQKTGDSTNIINISKDIIKKIKNNTKFTLMINVNLTEYPFQIIEQKQFTVKYNEMIIKNIQDDYGNHMESFKIEYKVYNSDYDGLNCFEYIDDNQVWAGQINNNITKSFHLDFDSLKLGEHIVKIVAIDKKGKKIERITSFTKVDKNSFANNRFGFIPLSKSKANIAVPHELMIDSDTGHIYMKNEFGETISKTEKLEKMLKECINMIKISNDEKSELLKITEIKQLIDNIVPVIYPNNIEDDSKIQLIIEKINDIEKKKRNQKHIGNTPPSDTATLLWIDTNDNTVKTYIDGKWERLYAGWI